MTKTKSTKRALLLSALSLLMCVSMLVGSTFAWFTDSVTSSHNKIQAGTLQIDLELLEKDGSWTSIKDSGKAIFDYENWEPGYTDVKILRVSNKGTLALKWLAKFVSNYELSALADVIDVYVNTTVDDYPADRSDLSGWTNVGTVRQFVNTISATTKGTLEAGASANLGIALKMQETADNRYQGMDLGGTFDIQIIATQYTSEEDSFDKNYDLSAAIYVENAAEAQAALDNAKKGDVIVLASGNYGTLFLRPVDGNANTTTSLNEANGEGLTVYRNEYIRTVEDLTILGTTGAKVDAIKVESGYIADSGSSCNLVDVKGLVIDSVEFTDKADCAPHTYSAPIFFNLTWTDVDGLTVKNCKLIGNNDKVNFVYFTIDSSSAFDGVASNVTLTGNTVDGIARLCELRQTENVTITNNTIKNTALHGILLAVHNGSYSGNVTITGNTAYGINERFVRMAGAGDANVVIKNNTINAYLGEDADYIKVTDSTGTPVIENNTITYGSTAAVQAALDNAKKGDVIVLASGNYGTLYMRPTANTNVTKEVDWVGNNYRYETYSLFENITILGTTGAVVDAIAIEGGTYYNTAHSQSATYPVMLSLVELKNVVIDGVTFTGNGGMDPKGHGNAVNLSGNNIKVDGLTLKNCVLKDSTNKNRLIYKTESTTSVHTYTYGGETFTFTPSLKDITVTDCTFDGGYMGLELRETENVTITNNVFNVADRNILLPVNTGCTYSGNITITGNVSNNAQERFVRADGTGDAVVVIKNNTLNNYQGGDADYIKVTNGNNVTIEDNTLN